MPAATNKEVLIPEKLRITAVELGSLWDIFNYLRLGNDNFNYQAYNNRRFVTDKNDKVGLKSLDEVNDTGFSNSVDINHIFMIMLERIGLNPTLWYGTVQLANNREYTHVWVTVNGQVWDLTTRTGRNYKRIHKIEVDYNAF